MTSLKADLRRRWIILGLAVTAVGLYIAAFFLPMWGFYLYAPQYPFGLTLSVYMNRVAGDVTEINILNHYIGMAKLDQAAQLERQLAGYGVAGIALAVLLMVFVPGRRFTKLFAVPAFLFPVAFLGLFYFWMWKFGHTLSPDAPVDVPPFTPKLLGKGQIGNFRTVGLPGAGFYLILASAVLAAAAVWLRTRVCAACPTRGDCRLLCKTPPKAVIEQSLKALRHVEP